MINYDQQGAYLHFSVDGVDYFCACGLEDTNENLTEYGLMPLYSPYYTAQADYKEVRLSNSGTLGWFIPINILEETDSSILSTLPEYLKLYASIALRKMIEKIDSNELSKNCGYFKITDFYSSDLIIFVYRTKIVNSNEIMKYLPSIYDNGFYLGNFFSKPHSCYLSSLVLAESLDNRLHGHKKITLHEIGQYKNNIIYIDLLYSELLPWVEDPYLRFLALYQVIEMLMGFQFSKEIVDKFILYQECKIDKNSLREAMIDISKEDTKINGIFENVTFRKEYQDNFMVQTELLFDQMGIDRTKIKSFADHVYKLRNTIFHSMRELVTFKSCVQIIIENFEKCIYDVLKTSPLTSENSRVPFIIDLNKKSKTNKKELARYITSLHKR